MHHAKEAIPENAELGDLAPVYWKFPKGMDSARLLEGLPDNMCPCPHWGYVIKGRMILTYADGTREEVKAGDLYYFPAGHIGDIKEDFEAVEFSPKEEFRQVLAHVTARMKSA